jgi:hypothetical protein
VKGGGKGGWNARVHDERFPPMTRTVLVLLAIGVAVYVAAATLGKEAQKQLSIAVLAVEVAATAWLARAIVVEGDHIAKQHAMTAKQQKLSGFVALVERVQDENVVSARTKLFAAQRQNLLTEDSSKWPPTIREDAMLVARRYDELGMLVLGLSVFEDEDKTLLIKAWGPSVRDSWEAVRPLVKEQRDGLGLPNRWEHFQSLAELVPPRSNQNPRVQT